MSGEGGWGRKRTKIEGEGSKRELLRRTRKKESERKEVGEGKEAED